MCADELLETMLKSYTSQASARSRFLHGCVEKELIPRASCLVRKEYSNLLNLAHQGIGDETMLALARPISELPGITVSATVNELVSSVPVSPC